MNDNAALNLIRNTFENSFDRERFLIFVKNLFHFLDTDSFIYRGNLIPDAYEFHIKTLERMGKYEDTEGHKIDVLAVQLNRQSSLERARTMQRNFIAWYLNGSRGGVAKDAALVAFYTKDSDDWRLSLVKMDYHLGESTIGKIKAITELTPARRFSFLVGANENTHTAQKQLLPILKDDDFRPRLADLETAFNVEVVTKDFFEKYKKLFLDTKEALEMIVAKDAKIKADFQEKNIDTADFAKKLLGQIVFLYFLQKKGWFGVARDADWGTGPKDFLRRLFEKQIAEYDNFFNNILEPLFYEALAVERPDDFYSRFDCKIPFLNGGLFDPLGNYDWVHTDIRLPDELFSNNRKTKEGDTGDGILDVFDRYNFTVKEDEPLEREVAVDPEMLGKVFENLLEVKDRKSKGTYYTPREIVHYMCQESLINYFLTELDGKVKRDDIETLIRLGETAIEHDKVVLEHGEEKGRYTFKLPQSIRENASFIDEKLEKIHVCDPAVGSGAFLVGMMTEVIRVRNVLTNYLSDNGRSIYDFKRHAIQNCLYGVDIDPGAVEIAKLRLWLSLIVDEEDIKQIKPLPNLDYKIMQGNSLLEEYEGIKLFDEELFTKSAFDNTAQIEEVKEKMSELQREYFRLHSFRGSNKNKEQIIVDEVERLGKLLKKLASVPKSNSEIISLFPQVSAAKQKADELKKLHQEFFERANKREKDEIKKQIEALEWDLIETTLREQNKLSLLPEIKRFKKANIKPFFLWKLNFSEVFEKNGGFDVVIANPPYVSSWNMGNEFKEFFVQNYKSATGHYDIYVLFIEKAMNLLRASGLLTFITSNKFFSQKYGYGVRAILLENKIKEIINFNFNVFETATVETCILVVEKNNNGNLSQIKILDIQKETKNVFNIPRKLIPQSFFNESESKNFRINLTDIKVKVLDKIKDKTIVLENICYIDCGIVVHSEKLKLKKDAFIYHTNKNNTFKKYIEGKNIEMNSIVNKDETFLDYQPKNHHRPKFPELFENEKILIKDIGGKSKINCCIDREGFYTNDSIRICVRLYALNNVNNRQIDQYLKGKDQNLSLDYDLRYLFALISSSVIKFYFFELICGGLHIYPNEIRLFPIKKTLPDEQIPFVEVVDKILAITKDDDYLQNSNKQSQVKEYEKQIDQLVFKLYCLTPEEIAVIENKK